VTVRFSPVVARAAAAASVARDRRIERLDDGSVEITYSVGDPLEIVRWSLSWGTEGEVIAPDSAREHARTIAHALAKTYGS
jgi:predicted DNA-binding transcriptional regulator YafY